MEHVSPPGVVRRPIRAWLTPAGRSDTHIWSMYIEGASEAEDSDRVHEGELALLVARAVRAGAGGFFVWSPTERSYVPSTAAAARSAD